VPRLSPFDGLVFDAAVSGPLESVTAPPYDVISDRRRLRYLQASEFNVVHLDLAEGTADPTHPENRYARAGHLLRAWEERGVLRRAVEPSCYAYEMSYDAEGAKRAHAPAADHAIRGLICAMTIEDWGGTVLPHERVRKGPVADRLALLRATRTHLSPVYGTIESHDDRLDMFVREMISGPAPFEAVDEQGVRHRMWPVDGDAFVRAGLGRTHDERLLIADGHHRYTTALRYRDERRRVDGPGPWDAVLTLVVDAAAEHMHVMPFHRVQLAGQPPSIEGTSVTGLAAMIDGLSDDDLTIGTISLDERHEVEYRMRHLEGEPPTVRALHETLLDGPGSNASLRYVTDAAEADAAVRSGEAVAAFLLPPTTPGRIRALVERGERLPAKSTYFWPKPLTGMIMMPLDPPLPPAPLPTAAADRAADPRADPTGRAS
jgi:uncharacterized protein (DUF1015 family)